jgi:hypothetical protein
MRVVPAKLSVDHGSVRDGAVSLDEVAERLESLRKLVDQSHIPPLALGVVGEGARYNYAVSLQDELANLATGIEKARTHAGNLIRSADHYQGVEDANVRAVLRDIHWIADPGGDSTSPPPPSSSAETAAIPAIKSPADLMTEVATAELLGYGAAAVVALGMATEANLRACAGMSALTIGTALAWETVVWADDGSVDRALRNWEQVAGEARALFGSDVKGVRQALQTAWQGTAASSADARLLEFVIAGMAFADRAERRVTTLRQLIGQLVWVHRIAFVVSTLMLVATISAIWSAGLSLAAVVTFAQTLTWAVAAIEGLLLSYGMIAMWGDAEQGFELKGADSGSTAEAVSVLTPPGSARFRPDRKAPPPFSF